MLPPCLLARQCQDHKRGGIHARSRAKTTATHGLPGVGLDAHTYIPDVLDQVRALKRRWVERDLRAQIDEQLDIDALFDEDGDYIGELYQPRRRRSLFVAA